MTSARISGLSPDTAYTFTVCAFDAAGNRSNQSDPLTVWTQEAGNDEPDDPVEDGPATGIPGTPSLEQNKWNGEASFGLKKTCGGEIMVPVWMCMKTMYY